MRLRQGQRVRRHPGDVRRVGLGTPRTTDGSTGSAEGHPERRLPERRQLAGVAHERRAGRRRRSPSGRGPGTPWTSPAAPRPSRRRPRAARAARCVPLNGSRGAARETSVKRRARDRAALRRRPTSRCVDSGPRWLGLELEVAQALGDRPQLAAAGDRGGGVDPDVGDADLAALARALGQGPRDEQLGVGQRAALGVATRTRRRRRPRGRSASTSWRRRNTVSHSDPTICHGASG